MPTKPRQPCRYTQCSNFAVYRGYCDTHKNSVNGSQRQSASQRGYNYKWQRARAAYLKRNPLCVYCSKNGRVTAATVVDHVTPHRGDMILFWQRSNWQALCKECHDRKTAQEVNKRREGA